MHQALITIKAQLEAVIAQVKAAVPNDEPFGNAHSNWSFPGLTRVELIEEAQSIIDLIDSRGGDDLGLQEARLNDYVRRLQHLQQHTIGQLWSNAGQAVPAYLFTLQGLRKSLSPVLISDSHAEVVVKANKLARQVRSLEARLNGLEPRTASLGEMVERIEQAHDAADQLPTDLETLAEARQKISDLVADATRDQAGISEVLGSSESLLLALSNSDNDAKAVLERCETAYSAATSVGLAAAFSERSSALSNSMWFWVACLAGALTIGSHFGSSQLKALSLLIAVPNASPSMIAINLLLAVLSVAAPVWFAWLATKQIGQRFRLAEDYAFKASVSRAYEGFRRETARFDKEMEARLLTSALTRLDELPLRLVEADSHGSPWHELASSDVVKHAMRAVPDFAGQVKDLASRAIHAVAPVRSPSKPQLKTVAESEGEQDMPGRI